MWGWLPLLWRARLRSALDRRVAARLAAELPDAVDDAFERARRARLLEPPIWGPPERLEDTVGGFATLVMTPA